MPSRALPFATRRCCSCGTLNCEQQLERRDHGVRCRQMEGLRQACRAHGHPSETMPLVGLQGLLTWGDLGQVRRRCWSAVRCKLMQPVCFFFVANLDMALVSKHAACACSKAFYLLQMERAQFQGR